MKTEDSGNWDIPYERDEEQPVQISTEWESSKRNVEREKKVGL